MELALSRTYHGEGSNGEVRHNGVLICRTIELPWRLNRRRVSCIPEGRYVLAPRYTAKRGRHIKVVNVPGRDAILIHPANHAKTELLGCIAPVSQHTGAGSGSGSRVATEALYAFVKPAFDRNEKVYLTIKTKTT